MSIRPVAILIFVSVLTSVKLQGQDLNFGAKIGAGYSFTDLTPTEFTFSTTDNETTYIVGIESERLLQGPVFQLEYKSKNRIAILFDLNLFSVNYEYRVETSPLFLVTKPKLSTDYIHASFAASIDLIQTKRIKPYLRVGASYNGLLGLEELEINQDVPFTEIDGREVRNTIIFNYLDQQNSTYYSMHAGIGFKFYNFFIEGLVDRNLTDLDANGAYSNQTKVFVNLGVNLLRFDLVKKQRYEN